MTSPHPPRWLQRTLSLLLSPRDRETISGDLLELYTEQKLPLSGRLRANAWYARQVLSFAPRALLRVSVNRTALATLCGFTALCGAWLGFMDVYLHHPHIAGHEAIAGTIVGQALLTLLALRFRRVAALRSAAAIGCAAILSLSGIALHGLLVGSDFEGYILLIALALAVQAGLTLLRLARDRALTRLP